MPAHTTRTQFSRSVDGRYAHDIKKDAEAPLIVQLYMEGNSLQRVAEILNREINYVSRAFHSEQGRAAYATYQHDRRVIREEIRDRATYAAQGALDEIIKLSQFGTTENVRRLASKDILEMADVGPQQAARGGTVFNIGDDAIQHMCRVMQELAAPVVDAETLPLAAPRQETAEEAAAACS